MGKAEERVKGWVPHRLVRAGEVVRSVLDGYVGDFVEERW